MKKWLLLGPALALLAVITLIPAQAATCPTTLRDYNSNGAFDQSDVDSYNRLRLIGSISQAEYDAAVKNLGCTFGTTATTGSASPAWTCAGSGASVSCKAGAATYNWTDADPANDPRVRGGLALNGQTTSADVCLDTTSVREFYLDQNSTRAKTYGDPVAFIDKACPTGATCANGACAGTDQTIQTGQQRVGVVSSGATWACAGTTVSVKCTLGGQTVEYRDTDSGNNPTTAGGIEYRYNGQLQTTVKDQCGRSDLRGTNYLVEYYLNPVSRTDNPHRDVIKTHTPIYECGAGCQTDSQGAGFCVPTQSTTTDRTGGAVCAQVLTPARNSTSRECKTFPTSCLDRGWVSDPSCDRADSPVAYAEYFYPITLHTGWNQIGLGAASGFFENPANCPLTPLYDYNPQNQGQPWSSPTRLLPLKGYFVYNRGGPCEVEITSYAPLRAATASLFRGWNMISASNKAWQEIKNACALNRPQIYRWNPAKFNAATNSQGAYDELTAGSRLVPGAGYWVDIQNNCVIKQ